jgi:hypothetical protein
LYFAHPAKLNDPFDCQPDIRKSAKCANAKLSGMKHDILQRISEINGFIDDIQRRMTIIGVCSFSGASGFLMGIHNT